MEHVGEADGTIAVGGALDAAMPFVVLEGDANIAFLQWSAISALREEAQILYAPCNECSLSPGPHRVYIFRSPHSDICFSDCRRPTTCRYHNNSRPSPDRIGCTLDLLAVAYRKACTAYSPSCVDSMDGPPRHRGNAGMCAIAGSQSTGPSHFACNACNQVTVPLQHPRWRCYHVLCGLRGKGGRSAVGHLARGYTDYGRPKSLGMRAPQAKVAASQHRPGSRGTSAHTACRCWPATEVCPQASATLCTVLSSGGASSVPYHPLTPASPG